MATELEKPRAGGLRHHKEKPAGGGFFQRLFQQPGSLFGRTSGPAMDVIDRASELVVRADLPGLDENDISVEVEGKTLTIWGERHEEREERDESYYFSERWEGSFKRSIELPEGVDPTRACATFDSGVLEVCFPKTAPKTPGRRIEVSGPSPQGAPGGYATPSEAGERMQAGRPSATPTQPAEEGAEAYERAPSTAARRIEVTEPSKEAESRVVTPPHTPAEDLGRH